MSKKLDPRAARTKEMFEQAVCSLLVENPKVSELTIQKLAERAKLNRTTFYLHYQDINDLISQITGRIIAELSMKVDDLVTQEALSEREQLVRFLDFLYQQRKLIGVIFETVDFERELFTSLEKLVETRRKNSDRKRPAYVAIEIRVASLTGILMWWLKHGTHLSSEYIADQIHLMYRDWNS